MLMNNRSILTTVRRVMPLLSGLILCAAIAVLARATSDTESMIPTLVDDWLIQYGTAGWAVIILIATVAMTAGFPRQVVAFCFGSMFGSLGGILVSLAVSCASCAIGFFIARRLLNRWVQSRFAGIYKRMTPVFETRPYAATLAIRLFPVGSNMLTNLVAGVTPINASAFILASAVGYLPQLIVFALLGAGIEQASAWQFSLSMILFAISIVLGMSVYRWYSASLIPVKRS